MPVIIHVTRMGCGIRELVVIHSVDEIGISKELHHLANGSSEIERPRGIVVQGSQIGTCSKCFLGVHTCSLYHQSHLTTHDYVLFHYLLTLYFLYWKICHIRSLCFTPLAWCRKSASSVPQGWTVHPFHLGISLGLHHSSLLEGSVVHLPALAMRVYDTIQEEDH